MRPPLAGEHRDALGRVDHRAAADAEHHVAARPRRSAAWPASISWSLGFGVTSVQTTGPSPAARSWAQQLGGPAGLDEPGIGDDERTPGAEPDRGVRGLGQRARARRRSPARGTSTAASGAGSVRGRPVLGRCSHRRGASAPPSRRPDAPPTRTTLPSRTPTAAELAARGPCERRPPLTVQGAACRAAGERSPIGRRSRDRRGRASPRAGRRCGSGPARSASRAPAAAPALGDHLGRDRHRRLLRRAGAEVEPDRARTCGRSPPR